MEKAFAVRQRGQHLAIAAYKLGSAILGDLGLTHGVEIVCRGEARWERPLPIGMDEASAFAFLGCGEAVIVEAANLRESCLNDDRARLGVGEAVAGSC